MDSNLKLYDIIYNNNQLINSQVLLNNIGIEFSIPCEYYFDKDNTNFYENSYRLKSNTNIIDIQISLKTKEEYENLMLGLNKKFFIKDIFKNFRNDNVSEFEENGIIYLLLFNGKYEFDLKCHCSRYSKEYYELYFIAYSLNDISNEKLNYEDIQKNNYCILKNGEHIKRKYKINIIKETPLNVIQNLSYKKFIDFLKYDCLYDNELKNEYLNSTSLYDELYNKIISVNIIKDDDKYLDIVE